MEVAIPAVPEYGVLHSDLGSAVQRNNPDAACAILSVSSSAVRPGSPVSCKLAVAVPLGDQDGTSSGKCSRVSFVRRAWRFIITTPLNKGRPPFNFLPSSVDHLVSRHGNLVSVEGIVRKRKETRLCRVGPQRIAAKKGRDGNTRYSREGYIVPTMSPET